MNPHILIGRILQNLIDQNYCLSVTGKKFEYLSHNSNQILVDREDGEPTRIPFEKLLIAIEAYQNNYADYDEGPGKTREYGIIHINSPVWALLHLLRKEDFLV